MANVTIHDIEAVDDYWGPTFRSILEGNTSEILSDQLEARIRSHDKDIERICNLYYQGFIDSIRELLQVRNQAANLSDEVQEIDTTLRKYSTGLLNNCKQLVRARQIESNIMKAIDSLSVCLPVLEGFSKLITQVKNKQYYTALKTLEHLENNHLVKETGYRFASQMKEYIPKLKENIKKSSEQDFREFLENIRKFSPKIGEVAMRHTKELQQRNMKTIVAEYERRSHEGEGIADEDVCAQDLIDFSPIYRCLHVYVMLNDKAYFEKDYRKQRKDQAKLILQPPQGMHDNLDAYKTYIYSIVGFFITEDHIRNTVADVVTKSYLDDLWSVSLLRIVNELSTASSSCTNPNTLLRIKDLIMLLINTLKAYGYNVLPLSELLMGMRDHYNEILLQRWVHVFHSVLEKESFLPLEVESQEEYDNILERFPFHSEQLENEPFPKTFPFSRMVPEVYHQTKEFMYACMKFVEDLALSPNEVATVVRNASNLLLSRSFTGCLFAIFRSPSIALSQLIQIIIDTQYLEQAGPFFDDFVCNMTGTEIGINHIGSDMFYVARSDAEKQVSDKICSKLDEFFGLFDYDWLLAEPHGNASPFITDLLSYLRNTLESFSDQLPEIARTACKQSCNHIANKFYNMLLDDEIKQISSGALQQINLDLLQCEFFAASEPVPGLDGAELTRYFIRIRQLLDLLIMEEWSTYLHDYGKSDNRYGLVEPMTIIVILEKIREADKRTMFSVLKKNERDKRKLWDTVLKQLRQLAEKQ